MDQIHKLKRPIWRILADDYNAHWKRGARVQVDAWKFDADTRDGVAYRVVNMGKRPKWFTLSWFKPVFMKGN